MLNGDAVTCSVAANVKCCEQSCSFDGKQKQQQKQRQRQRQTQKQRQRQRQKWERFH